MINVNRPLDYEQIPNGMIYLTVMVKDGGNPALNNTVPVTVEVIVSTTRHNARLSVVAVSQKLIQNLARTFFFPLSSAVQLMDTILP